MTVLIDQTRVITCLAEVLLKSLRVDQVELRPPHSHTYNNDQPTQTYLPVVGNLNGELSFLYVIQYIVMI